MPKETSPGRPTTRRYSDAEKANAVRLVRQLRVELGTDYGTVQRIARQLGYGVESVRTWVREADAVEGLAGTDAQRVRELEAVNKELSQRNRELERANEVLRKASARLPHILQEAIVRVTRQRLITCCGAQVGSHR